MENRGASRTYGSLDDQSTSRSSSPELLSAQARESLLEREKVGASHGSYDMPESSRGYSRRSWVTAGIICAMGVGTVMFVNRSGSPPAVTPGVVVGSLDIVVDGDGDKSGSSSGPAGKSHPRAEPKVTAGKPYLSPPMDAELSFSVTNFYHTRDGKPGGLIPWLQGVHLAEPYRETTLTIANPKDGHDYMWEVREKDGEDKVLASASGPEASIVFTLLDWNTVTVTETDPSGGTTRMFTDTVMVKYVRREIRTLTDDERTELLDSMAILWDVRVQGGEGKELYGNDYSDIWAINRLHFMAASGYECDHFHDGLGFLSSHSMMTNTFEYNLQVVNPKLTVPYWDFTIESSTFGGNSEDIIEPQDNSPLFSAEWFGRHDPDDLMLKDGRWGYTEIPKMKTNNPGRLEVDVYSKLRAPWNVNDRAYLSRGMGKMCGVRVEEKYPWPSCQSHYDLNTAYTDFYSWVWESLYGPHGPVHVWLGGVMDCEETYEKIAALVGKEISAELAYFSFVHRKNLFRAGLFKCETLANVDETPGQVLQSGKCGCLDFDLTQGDDYILIMESMVFVSSYVDGYSDDVQRQIIATLCNGVANDGDHLQASSSLDPSFWVTHPTMERLWMFKRLTGTMTDLTWPDADTYVLDEEAGTTSLEVLSLYGEDCAGHRGSDVFPFGLAVDDGDPGFMARTGIKGDEVSGNSLTNREILQALDPRVNKLSYIYDTFEWSHCDMDGIHMSDTWAVGAAEARKAAAEKPTKKRPTFKEGEIRYPLFDNFKLKAKELENMRKKETEMPS